MRTHLDFVQVNLSGSNKLSRGCGIGGTNRSKSFSPHFKMTRRAAAFPTLESKGDYDFANERVAVNVAWDIREFSPIEPANFITGRVN